MTPEELGRLQGQGFAKHAVDVRRRGCPVETWCEFMRHRTASLSKMFDTQEDIDRWSTALLEAYQDALDNRMESILVLLEPEGNA